jgi:hypothetical protein
LWKKPGEHPFTAAHAAKFVSLNKGTTPATVMVLGQPQAVSPIVC